MASFVPWSQSASSALNQGDAGAVQRRGGVGHASPRIDVRHGGGAIRTSTETSATCSNLLRPTPTIISGGEAREAFAEPDDPGELNTPTD